MSKLLRRLAMPLIALTIAAGLFTHVAPASAATIVQISNCDGRLEQFQNSGGKLHHRWQVSKGGSWSGWVDMRVWMSYGGRMLSA